MVSFRDQQNNGVFDLNSGNDPNDPDLLNSREYLYIHDLDYNANQANEDISNQSGGIAFANMYYFWPVLAPNQDWNPDDLNSSVMRILFNSKSVAVAEASAVYDAYGSFGRQNIDNLHPDHHHLTLIPMDANAGTFMIVNGNDGGLGISTDNGDEINQITNGYVTTQFYGADKKPGEDKYIGGTQDNGTWVSTGTSVDETNEYNFVIGGDGFEVLWHPTEKNLVLGTIYNNLIYKSVNGGETFEASSSGIGEEDGPFITRLASSVTSPNTVFAIGNLGVYRSTDFGDKWSLRLINDDNWGGNSSSSDVEVSLANDKIVWAGAGMAEGALNLFVSTNGGNTFNPTSNYSPDPNAFFTGIYTHPTEDSTAYALFSLSDFPKILKTTDLGQSWNDISGFEESETGSSRGFPDVFVHSLLVMPFDTDIIWAGTEIGLFETLDGGESWNIRNEIPSVSIWSMKIVDNQVVIGTHGRGIWTAEIDDINFSTLKVTDFNYLGYGKAEVSFNLKSDYDNVTLEFNNEESMVIEDLTRGANKVSIENVRDFKSPVLRIIGSIGEEQYFSPKFNSEDIDVTPDILNFSVGRDGGIYPISIEVENNEPFEKVEVLFNSEVVYTDERVLAEDDGNRVIEFDYDQVTKSRLQIRSYINGQEYISTAEEQIVTSNQNEENNGLKIYPNPALEYVVISNQNIDLKEIKIYSSNGILVKKQILSSSESNLDISNLDSGIYLFQLVDAKGKIFTKRIIKK